MQLENTFTVPVPVEQAWAALLDIERIAPCVPGATVTAAEGDDFTGTLAVELGPAALMFQGSGSFVERDEAARRMVISASGADSGGGGTARARVTAALVAEGDGTRVRVSTDLDVTGEAAQAGPGPIGDAGERLIGGFADRLAATLTGPALVAAAGSAPVAAAGDARAGEPMAPVQPDAEPADLLAVPGVGTIVRRAVPYVVTAATSFAVVLGIIWWIRRR
ncbi:SRPBCC family protein [Dactylosporangium sp. NPDC000244]|uniref:SRPBCC family protein n=1 Tax=Dactylosporangium sp. NPDC000244 TaxID=3154365 RepID=UPI003329E8B2